MSDTILSCDWGTTNVRLRRVDLESGRILAEASAAAGVKRVFDGWMRTDRLEHYANALRPLLDRLGRSESDRALIVSGMASSSIGIAELPYADVPFRLDGSDLVYRVLEVPTVDVPVLLLSGVRTSDDAMRGEETELIGLWRTVESPPPKAHVLLPGTHSKHVLVENGAIVSLRTYMTGELFDVLARTSMLRDGVEEGAFDTDAFVRGVRASRDAPLLGLFFTVRTNRLFDRLEAGENYWYLSGLLVGSEIGALPATGTVYLCGTSRLAPVYRAAIETLAATDRTVFVPEETTRRAVVEGHLAAYRLLLKSP